MKKRVIITAIVIGLLSLIVYVIPILVASSNARPLYGNFDVGMECMGGHEIFFYLDEDEAFEHCPGHRNMRIIGPIERSENSVTIYLEDGDTPWCRIDHEGSDYTFMLLITSSSHALQQVNNPWRAWLPKFAPEH